MTHLPPDLVLNMRPLVVTALLADGQSAAAAEEAAAILRDADAAIPERPRLANMRDWLRSIACHAEAHRDATAAIAQCDALLTDLGPDPSTRIAARALLGLGIAHGARGDSAAAIDALQQRHYAAAPSHDAGANLAEAFKRGFAWRAAEATDENSGLPPLYPFKLH